ncbi:MAG: metallophosphoesterase [Chloroflexia bacterium]
MTLQAVNKSKVELKQKMKVLVVSDLVEPQLYNASVKEWLGPIDLVISCGDLPAGYLDFLMSMIGVPLVHVLGNHCSTPHDPFEEKNPFHEEYPGAFDLNGRVAEYNGLILAGMEGSPLYNNGPHQYTEQQATWNLLRLCPALLREKVRTGRYLDIMVTHAPPRGIHDGTDVAHKGFKALLPFLERFRPALLLHGHSHRYDPLQPVHSKYGDTEIINVYGHALIDLVRDDTSGRWSIGAKKING